MSENQGSKTAFQTLNDDNFCTETSDSQREVEEEVIKALLSNTKMLFFF
jgi:hypothetical protein